MMNIQELDVTSDELQDMAHSMEEAGVDATYNGDLREIVVALGRSTMTFVQTTAAESDEMENAYWHMDAQAIATEVTR